GELPETFLAVEKAASPLQVPLVKNSNETVPARAPPALAETVAESLGTHVCALDSDEGTVLTTTSSLLSVHWALCVVPELLVLPLYDATQW
ncbi:hypothetical protein C5C07_20695, partial [Haloferax sp. Atlit-4N]|uniref:agmatine deiminase family protein n=1 Tax=Haloferax sp. Atlit-4N TaxID=2077206 RepID=UPI000E39E928